MRRQGKVADEEFCEVLLAIQDEEVEPTNAVVQQEQDARNLWTQSSETNKAGSKSSDTVLQSVVRELRDLDKLTIKLENKRVTLVDQRVLGPSKSDFTKSASMYTSLLGRTGNCGKLSSLEDGGDESCWTHPSH